MDLHRKSWNQGQQALRSALSHPAEHQHALELFLNQHAALHARALTQPGVFYFDDELWQGLPDEAARLIPLKGEHSIAWMIWHAARCEDITMSLLVAGEPQVLFQGDWLERMKIAARDTGNCMDQAEIAGLSASIDIGALRAYRSAVCQRTRQIVSQLGPGDLKRKVPGSRFQHVWDEGAVLAGAAWLVRYWSSLTVAGLLLMPPTRHNFVHLNEAMGIKPKALKRLAA
jgi:hypothetical protein